MYTNKETLVFFPLEVQRTNDLLVIERKMWKLGWSTIKFMLCEPIYSVFQLESSFESPVEHCWDLETLDPECDALCWDKTMLTNGINRFTIFYIKEAIYLNKLH